MRSLETIGRCRLRERADIAVLVVAVAVTGSTFAAEPRALYSEPHRPQLHFSPAEHWMNDPNGPIWVDGIYHLFFQYHPHSTVWGPMHWGHATSRDLLHWTEQQIAIAPTRDGMAFSGSVVLDRHNTSGFGSMRRPAMVAIFTTHDERAKQAGKMGFETQSLAFSTDGGSRWQVYDGNPVLRQPDSQDFRDPFVFWHDDTARWVGILTAGEHLQIHSSADLKSWKHESDLVLPRSAGAGVWECPGLVRLGRSADSRRRWLLLASVVDGGPNGGSATRYFLGKFDGHRFVPDAMSRTTPRWVDWGRDNYAGTLWANLPADDDRTLFIGWMSNWRYAQQLPTERWRSAMTLPRELRVARDERGDVLASSPIRELATLRRRTQPIATARIAGTRNLSAEAGVRGGLYDLELRVRARAAASFTLRFENGSGESLRLLVDREQRRYVLDRARTGNVGFSPGFADRQIAPMAQETDTSFSLRVLLDHSAAEFFLDGGRTVLTTVFFPTTPLDSVHLDAQVGVVLERGSISELASIWRDAARRAD